MTFYNIIKTLEKNHFLQGTQTIDCRRSEKKLDRLIDNGLINMPSMFYGERIELKDTYCGVF